MANRNYASGGKVYSMNVKPVMVNATIVIGASGAVASSSGAMVQAVTKTATGIYKIKLQANTAFYESIFQAGSAISPSSGLSGILAVEIQNAPTTNGQISTGAEIIVKTLDEAGVLADPASGSAINVLAIFNDSSVRTQA